MKKSVATTINFISDEDLIRERLSNRKQELFEILFERYKKKVYHKCLSFTKSPDIAEDLAHDIFLKIFFKLPEFQFKSSFSTWLYAITYNFCIDYQKKKTDTQQKHELYEHEQETVYVENDDEELFSIKAERLWKLIAKLEPGDKAIILMKYQDDLSIKEIQEIMKMGESAVKMRISRIKNRLIEMNKKMDRPANSLML